MATYLNLVPAYTVSTPHTPSMDPGVATLDLRARVAMSNWTGAAEKDLLDSWGGPGDAFLFAVENNRFKVAWRDSNLNVQIPVSTVNLDFAADSLRWVRALLNPGAGTCDFYTSNDGSSWTSSGTQITGLSTVGIRTSGSPDAITAAYQTGGSTTWTGKFYRSVMIVNGVTISDMDWNGRTVGSHDTTYVASTGETWTTSGGATIDDDSPTAAPRRSMVRRA